MPRRRRHPEPPHVRVDACAPPSRTPCATRAPADPTASVLVAPVGRRPGRRRRRPGRARGAGHRRRRPARDPRAAPPPPARSPPCPCPRRPRRAAGRCSSASATARTAAWRTAGAAVGRATRGTGEVVHAVGDTASGSALAAYVETVVLASWASPRWTSEGAVAGCDPVADRRRHRHDGCRRRAAGGRAGPGPARRPRAGRDPVEHQEPGLAGPPGPHRGAAHRPRGAGLGRAPAARPTASAASSPSARARPPRRGWSGSTTSPRGATAATPRVVLVGKGITFDTGGPAGQAGRRHGRHEDRHDRRRPSCSRCSRPAASSTCRCGSPACSPSPRTPSAAARTAPATSSRTTAAAPSRSATPTPRAASCWPTRSPTPTPTSTPTCWSTSPRSPARPRIALGRALAPVFATDAGLADALVGRRRDDWRDAVADAAAGHLPSSSRLRRRRRQPHRPGVGGGAITAALFLRSSWASAGGRTSTSPAPVARTSTPAAPPRGPPGSGPDCCCGGWRRWHERRVRADGPLVAGERPGGRRRPAARVRRRHLDRAVHVPRRPGLQGLADARGGVVRGLLRLRHASRTARSSARASSRGAANAPGSRSSARRRCSSRSGRSSRSPRAPRASAAAPGPTSADRRRGLSA